MKKIILFMVTGFIFFVTLAPQACLGQKLLSQYVDSLKDHTPIDTIKVFENKENAADEAIAKRIADSLAHKPVKPTCLDQSFVINQDSWAGFDKSFFASDAWRLTDYSLKDKAGPLGKLISDRAKNFNPKNIAPIYLDKFLVQVPISDEDLLTKEKIIPFSVDDFVNIFIFVAFTQPNEEKKGEFKIDTPWNVFFVHNSTGTSACAIIWDKYNGWLPQLGSSEFRLIDCQVFSDNKK